MNINLTMPVKYRFLVSSKNGIKDSVNYDYYNWGVIGTYSCFFSRGQTKVTL